MHMRKEMLQYFMFQARIYLGIQSAKKLLMEFRNEFVHIMYEVNPDYEQYIIEEH